MGGPWEEERELGVVFWMGTGRDGPVYARSGGGAERRPAEGWIWLWRRGKVRSREGDERNDSNASVACRLGKLALRSVFFSGGSLVVNMGNSSFSFFWSWAFRASRFYT